MSAKRAFFGILQKFMVVCCAMFFGFANAFSANLPSGYTELEYIQSTGTQYITTDVIANQNTSAEVKFVPTSVYMSNGVFGARTSRTSNAFNVWEPGSEGVIIANYNNKGSVVSNVTPVLNETYVVYLSSTRFSVNNNTVSISNTGSFSTPGGLQLFNIYGGDCSTTTSSSGANRLFSGKVYYFKVWQGDSLALNLVPAKNSSGVVGMYDTVSGNFFTNKGTGTFTAGPVVQASLPNEYQEIVPFDTILYPQTLTGWKQRVVTGADNIVNYGSDLGLFYLEGFDNKVGAPLPGVVSNNFKSVKTSGWAKNDDKYFETRFQMSGDTVSSHRLYFRLDMTHTTLASAQTYFNEHPTTVLYLPETPTDNTYVAAKRISDNTVGYYCVSGTNRGSFVPAYGMTGSVAIKIATTAYNNAQFNPVVTDLNTTIATIRSVVTNTINQTKAIADLQAKKQTRPDEQCPAGKKCLLVEDNDGVPHWYEIIENIYGLPTGYTALEYIQSDGNSWIETDYRGTEKTGAYLKYQYHTLSSDLGGRIFGYRIAEQNQWVAYIGTYTGTTVNTTTYYMQSGAMSTSPEGMPTLDRNIHEVKINTDGSGKIYFDSRLVGNSLGATAFTASQTLRLFSAYNNSSYSNATARIYEVGIYENGIIKKHFVPAKHGTTVGMYDTVNGVFYQNAGTGTFTAGPEI